MIEILRGLKICILDIETSDLRADYGQMFCVVIKEYLGKRHVLRIDDDRNPDKNSDKWLVKETIEVMNKFDVIVTWYGTFFDRPFIQTRALKHRLKWPNKYFSRDLIFTARGKALLTSNKLSWWDRFMLERNDKTWTPPHIKRDAIKGRKYALDFIVNHCKIDVDKTEKFYKMLLPYLSNRIKRT